MNPTLYDILGVPPDASPDEIKRAWRAAAERFDPGSGTAQFRLFNEAAEVLLDPERRAEYDAGLAPADDGRSGDREPAVADAEPEPGDVGEPEPPAHDDAGPASPGSEDFPKDPTLVTEEDADQAARRGARMPPWALGTLFLAAVLCVVATSFFTVQSRQAQAVEQARDEAPAVADKAAGDVLAYNYRHLDADRASAAKFLSPSYRKKYLKTFDSLVVDPAKQTKARVTAQVEATGVTRADPDRVQVLLYVNQVTKSTAHDQPQTALNRVRFEMVKSSGDWLVNDITSY